MNLNMKKARIRAGLSQKQVALTLKVSAPTVSEWESGKKNPNAANLKKLAEMYRTTTGFLLGLEQENFYSESISRKMCEEIARIHQEEPEKFSNFLIPQKIWEEIQNGTYRFSDITFKQFSEVIGKGEDQFSDHSQKADSELDKALEGVDFALYGATHDLTAEEKQDVLKFVDFLKSKRGE